MKIAEFIDKFTIDPNRDIKPNFKLTKTLDVDFFNHKGCFNCEDKINQTRLKTSGWNHVQYCWHCNHLNVIYEQDRMSGVQTDHIECYTEK